MLPVMGTLGAATFVGGPDRLRAERPTDRTGAGGRRPSIVSVLAVSLLLVALVPFLPLAVLAWWSYHQDLARIEEEIRASNRHIAVLAGHYLETLLRQVREEISVYEKTSTPGLPPRLEGVVWESVGDDGRVLLTQLDPARVDQPCGYGNLLSSAGTVPYLSDVGDWIGGSLPTVLIIGGAASAGRLVAILDPTVLHDELQAWKPDSADRHLYVVERSGRLLFYSDLRLSQRGADLSMNPPIRLFVEGGEGDIDYTSIVSDKERLGTVHRLTEVNWGVIVSADVGASLFGLRSRTGWLACSIAFAFGTAMVILAVTSRRLVRPALDIARALRDPGRDPNAPLPVPPFTRRLREYDQLVSAFDELGAEFAAVERELVQAEKTSQLGQLASGLAHEMGTPLNVITGNAEYLLRKAGEDDPTWPTLELIIRQGQRIAAMIRRLLDVSRPAEARLVPVELAPLVRQSLEIVPGLNRRVEVRSDLEGEACRVLADPKLIEHTLMNLILNACQAMPEGGRLTVVTGLETVGPRRIIGRPGGGRHRVWHCRRGPAADLRALLHHQGPGCGYRARPADRRPHRAPARRQHRGDQRAGARVP